MKILKIGLATLVVLYVGIIIIPFVMVYVGPYDGTVDEVKPMLEWRDSVLSQWSPITGIWGAEGRVRE